MTTKTTVKAVNAALAKRGNQERLRRGRGYFYFYGGTADSWRLQGVYVYNVDAFTIEGWLK